MGANGWDGGGISSDSGLWWHVTTPLSHKSAPFSWWRGGGGEKKHTGVITATRLSRILPLPRQTSAKWQPLSPGSLQNSTTSRHVVSGVMGTSVTACSPSLRYTVNIIWGIGIQSWGLKEWSVSRWWRTAQSWFSGESLETQAPTFCLRPSMWTAKITSFSPRCHQITFTRD